MPTVGTVSNLGSSAVSAGVFRGLEVLYYVSRGLLCIRVSDLDQAGEYQYDAAKRLAFDLRARVQAEGGAERLLAQYVALLG